MADTIVRDDVTGGTVFKTFAVSTTNTLFSHDHSLLNMYLEGSKYGRPFIPNRVTISYGDFTSVKAFALVPSPSNTASSTLSGSVTYYDPNSVLPNTRPFAFQGKDLLPFSAMPSWLSALVSSQI